MSTKRAQKTEPVRGFTDEQWRAFQEAREYRRWLQTEAEIPLGIGNGGDSVIGKNYDQ